jgi:hypothetical protein
MRMSRWTGRLVIVGGLCWLLGWGLVLASGHGGNSTGGSEAVWTFGGLMTYVSIPLLVLAAMCELASRLRSVIR